MRPTKEQAKKLRQKHPYVQLPVIPCRVCGREVCTERLPYCSSACQKSIQAEERADFDSALPVPEYLYTGTVNVWTENGIERR